MIGRHVGRHDLRHSLLAGTDQLASIHVDEAADRDAELDVRHANTGHTAHRAAEHTAGLFHPHLDGRDLAARNVIDQDGLDRLLDAIDRGIAILFGRFAVLEAREMKDVERELRRGRERQNIIDLPDREAAALAKNIGLRSGMSQAAQDRALDAYLAKKG